MTNGFPGDYVDGGGTLVVHDPAMRIAGSNLGISLEVWSGILFAFTISLLFVTIKHYVYARLLFSKQPQMKRDAFLPSRTGMFLVAFFVKPELRESTLGCMEERHFNAVKRFGPGLARILFLRDTVGTIVQFLVHLLWKPILSVASAIGLRKYFG